MAPVPQQFNPGLCVVCELLLISHALQGSRGADTSVMVLMTYTLIVPNNSWSHGLMWLLLVPIGVVMDVRKNYRARFEDPPAPDWHECWNLHIACLILKGQMEITTMSPKMDWRCPVITVGYKLWLFFIIIRLTFFFFEQFSWLIFTLNVFFQVSHLHCESHHTPSAPTTCLGKTGFLTLDFLMIISHNS